MGKIRTSIPVKLFVSALSSLPETIPEVEARLATLFGPMDSRSEAFPFDSTHYYDREMGTPIRRWFFAFAGLIAPDRIASIKTQTNALEAALAAHCTQVQRPANLDPGYLELGKVVLASTKNFSHRVLLADGIYAEVTLYFRRGQWCSFPWTFPDFRSGRYDPYFTSLRRIYHAQLKAKSPRDPS